MGTGHAQLLQVEGFSWCSWQWCVSADVPVSMAGGVVLFRWLVWCGVGTGVPILEAGGVVSFGWRGDMAPQGVHGVGGGARCHVVVVVLLCGPAGPVGVDRHDSRLWPICGVCSGQW
jgi:hypothetical protein